MWFAPPLSAHLNQRSLEINMENVRAKFKCNHVIKYDGGSEQAFLSVVTGGSEENKKFWKYTPGGEIKLHIDNPEAAKMFEPGCEYYINISKA